MHSDLNQPDSGNNPRPNARRVREHPYPRSARPHGGSGRATQTDPNCELTMPDEDAYCQGSWDTSASSSTTPSTTSSGAAIRGRHRPACSCPWTSSSACQSSAMASPPPREQGVHAAGVDDWLHRGVGLAPGKGLRQRASTKGIRHALAQHPCRDDGAMLRHRQFATNQQVRHINSTLTTASFCYKLFIIYN